MIKDVKKQFNKWILVFVVACFLSTAGYFELTTADFRLFILTQTLCALAAVGICLWQLAYAKKHEFFRKYPVIYVLVRVVIILGALMYVNFTDLWAEPIETAVSCESISNSDNGVVSSIVTVNMKTGAENRVYVPVRLVKQMDDEHLLTGSVNNRRGCSRPITISYLPRSRILVEVN